MMSAKRHQQMLSGVNALAVKVYNCVPMGESWPAAAIRRELDRRGMSMTMQVSSGCLNALVTAGLVKESREGFMRVPVREKLGLADLKDVLPPAGPAPEPALVPEPKEEPMSTITPIKPAPAPSAVETLLELSQQAAAMAVRHQQELSTLSNLIADAAIDAQAELEKKDADLVKWNQMQALLKGMAA